MLIIFSGKQYSGKDTAAKILLAECPEYKRCAMGDIIKLDKKMNEELNVYVGDINKFTALPGSADDKYAVRITSVLRGDE